MRHSQKTEQAPALRTGLLVEAMRLLSRSILYLSMASSHPLFSILITSSLLAFLYLPRPLIRILLSPVPVSALLLLATLLRLGSLPKLSDRALNDDELIRPPPSPTPPPPPSPPPEPVKIETDEEFVQYQQKSNIYDEFFEWCRRSGPLEVIYEEYEGEEAEEEEEDYDGGVLSPGYATWKQKNAIVGIEGLSSLGLIEYTDSDTGSCSSPPPPAESWTSPESMCYRWEDEEEDELIEIALEEDNLIEIDISRGR